MQQTLPTHRGAATSRCVRSLTVLASLGAFWLALAPVAMAEDGSSGRHHRPGHGERGYDHGSYRHHGDFGFALSASGFLDPGRAWGHGYGSFFGGHGFLVTSSDLGFFSHFFDHRGRRNRRSHRHRWIRHPDRWLYGGLYHPAYLVGSPYSKTTSRTANSPISGYDGTIGSYLGYEPLPVKKPETTDFDTRPLPGTLSLSVEPNDASVYLDGEFLGVASELPTSLVVNPGSHRLEVARPGHEPLELELEVAAGETVEIERVLSRAGH